MARSAPLWQQNNSYSAQVDRQILAALWPNGGAVGAAPSAVANTLTVNVPAGRCAVPMSDGTVQLCRWDATEVVGPLNAGPGAGTSRIDLIVVNARDSAISGTNDDFQIIFLTGTAAASPVPPNMIANAYALTQILVPASVANLNTATLTDLRNKGTVGGIGTDPAWTPPTLTNAWTVFAARPPGYRRINGMVYLRGAVGAGSSGTSAFTLPSGYRPSADHSWVAKVGSTPSAVGQITIRTTGNVEISAGTTSDLNFASLDAVVFDADGN